MDESILLRTAGEKKHTHTHMRRAAFVVLGISAVALLTAVAGPGKDWKGRREGVGSCWRVIPIIPWVGLLRWQRRTGRAPPAEKTRVGIALCMRGQVTR